MFQHVNNGISINTLAVVKRKTNETEIVPIRTSKDMLMYTRIAGLLKSYLRGDIIFREGFPLELVLEITKFVQKLTKQKRRCLRALSEKSNQIEVMRDEFSYLEKADRELYGETEVLKCAVKEMLLNAPTEVNKQLQSQIDAVDKALKKSEHILNSIADDIDIRVTENYEVSYNSRRVG